MLYIKSLLLIFFILLSSKSYSQTNFYVASSNNDLVFVDIENCSSYVLCNTGLVMFDIALTPNHELYSTDGKKVFHIDTNNCSNILITPTPVTDNNYNGGNWITSLVAFNNDILLAVSTDALLYKIEINSGLTYSIGSVNYSSGGDLTWYKGDLLLATASSQLVRITLDENCSQVNNVQLIGTMETDWNSIYGILTIGDADCSKDNLTVLAFENQDIYIVDPTNASLELICDSAFQFYAYGAASATETSLQEYTSEITIPNVFTPNNDGINDFFNPIKLRGIESISITILNRWGELVYKSDKLNFSWNGENGHNNLPCTEGVYFYIVNYNGTCNEEKSTHGHLSLLR